jgi:hypothetical protein
MLQWQPVFGVGVGQYFLWSGTFSSPELRSFYPRENAHNNFAQIAGELGIVGLTTFLALLVICLFPWRRLSDSRFLISDFGSQRQDSKSPWAFRGPVIAGLAVFIVSCLGGHPLLVPEIAYPFWITLGVVPGITFAGRPTSTFRLPVIKSRTQLAAVALAIVLLATIPYRVYDKQLAVDLSRLDYGFVRSSRGQAGEWPRRIDDRARIFVPVHARDISIRLRSPSASFDRSEEVLIRVNGNQAELVRLSDPSWQIAPVALPFVPNRRFHRVDLEVLDHAHVEVGGWEIISEPDG